jgi:hypothetical protein
MPGMTRQHRILDESVATLGPRAVIGTYQMTPRDHHLRIVCTVGGYTITLPPVVECAGGFYLLRCISGTATVTIVDKGDSAIVINDTMNAQGEQMMVYSDGEAWNFIIIPPA